MKRTYTVEWLWTIFPDLPVYRRTERETIKTYATKAGAIKRATLESLWRKNQAPDARVRVRQGADFVALFQNGEPMPLFTVVFSTPEAPAP